MKYAGGVAEYGKGCRICGVSCDCRIDLCLVGFWLCLWSVLIDITIIVIVVGLVVGVVRCGERGKR